MSIHVLDIPDAIKPGALAPEVEQAIRQYVHDMVSLCYEKNHKVWYGTEHPFLSASLCKLIALEGSKSVLEVGFQSAMGGVPMAVAVHLNGGTYLGIDNLSDSDASDLIKDLASSKTPGNAEFRIIDDAYKQCRAQPLALRDDDGPYDFVFIDHSKGRYLQDFQYLSEMGKLLPGAVILLHDAISYRPNPFTGVVEWVDANSLGECSLLQDLDNRLESGNLLTKKPRPLTCPDLGMVRWAG